MYNSLLEWMVIPAQLVPATGSDDYNTKTFGSPVDITCYAFDKITVVVNSMGIEAVSKTTIYLKGETAITEADHIIYGGVNYPIKALGSFYDLGVRSIWVVYV